MPARRAAATTRKLNYISPRVAGLQIGVSYAPDDTAQDAAPAPRTAMTTRAGAPA